MKEMDKEISDYKHRQSELEGQCTRYNLRVNEMNSIIRSILIKLQKIKDEHLSMKLDLEQFQKENEFLKDRHGIDLAELTPRPNWDGLKEKYNLKEINEEEGEIACFYFFFPKIFSKIFFEKIFFVNKIILVGFQSTCLIVEKLAMNLTNVKTHSKFSKKSKRRGTRMGFPAKTPSLTQQSNSPHIEGKRIKFNRSDSIHSIRNGKKIFKIFFSWSEFIQRK